MALAMVRQKKHAIYKPNQTTTVFIIVSLSWIPYYNSNDLCSVVSSCSTTFQLFRDDQNALMHANVGLRLVGAFSMHTTYFYKRKKVK